MSAEPERHRFDVAAYDRMVEAGVFREGDRVELIEGEIVEMTPIGPRHSFEVSLLVEWFVQKFRGRAIVWTQSPITLPTDTKPQPDLALVRPPRNRYADAHPEPRDVLLVVEVADTSIFHDRLTKARLYAQARIPEYWIIHISTGRVIVHRQPSPDGYQLVSTSRRGEILAPDAFPDVTLRTDDILPEWPAEPVTSREEPPEAAR